MFKNYLKLTLKVLMRRKMISFINLFGICFTLTILLAATTIYTLMVVSNPIQKNLSNTLILNQVTFRDKEKQSMSSGPAMPYFIEKCVSPLKSEVKYISFCSAHCNAATIYLNNQRIDIDTRETDENYWKISSFTFIEGRPYDLEEIRTNPQTIVLCKSLKDRIFGEISVLGKTLKLNNKNYKIIGVVNDVPAIYKSAYAQVWYPYNYASYVSQVKDKNFNSWMYQVQIETKTRGSFDAVRNQEVAKLTPPERFKQTEAELESSSQFVFKSLNDRNQWQTILIAFILLFSLLPLLNLTNLTVSRIFERSSEIGVRKAFGATKRQMAMQFVYENVLITCLGGIFGFIGAWLLLKGIDASGLIQLGNVNFSFRVFAYGFLVILVFGIISGFYPALKMSKLQIVNSLKGGIQ